MDIVDHMQYAHLTGRSFGLAEQAAIRNATIVLLNDTKHQHAELWGKVIAQQADYIVVTCFTESPLEGSHFFSTNGGIDYSLLPPPSAAAPPKAQDQPDELKNRRTNHKVTVANLCKQIQGTYIGDPAYEYRVADPISGCIYCIRESERLACFIQEHGERCRVVPRGAFSRRERPLATQMDLGADAPLSVAQNATFEGLDRAAAGRLTSYVHLRWTIRDRSLLEKENTASSVDFLDTIADDIPAGVWNLRYDPVLDVVYGTSNAYFGTVFFHQPESKTVYGNVYVGDGSANQDLAFML